MVNASNKAPTVHHAVRYGTPADAAVLQAYGADFDQLIVSANMVAHAPAAVAGCIAERLVGKPFVIDPMSHVLQHAPTHLLRSPNIPRSETNPVKRTWAKLAEAYGDVFVSAVRAFRPVVPGQFAADAVANSVADVVVQFQEKALKSAFDSGPDRDLLEFARAGSNAGADPVTPAAVVAPYSFVAEAEAEAWLDVNRRLALAARAAVPHRRRRGTVSVALWMGQAQVPV